MTANIRLMSWGMPLLYVGPAFPLPRHSKAVGLLCVCLDGHMEIQTAARDNTPRRLSCVSAYIDPGVRHDIRFQAGRIACLYTDAANAHLASIASGMKPLDDGVYVDHGRQSAIIEALAGKEPLAHGHRKGIAEAFGFSELVTQGFDERVAEVMATILSDPGQPHRATTLARQVGLSESRLRHAFRQAPGISFKRFRLWARMGSGLSLVGSGANLTNAAHESGFSSSAHFSTAYRTMFGVKPSAVVSANPLLRGSSKACPLPA